MKKKEKNAIIQISVKDKGITRFINQHIVGFFFYEPDKSSYTMTYYTQKTAT